MYNIRIKFLLSNPHNLLQHPHIGDWIMGVYIYIKYVLVGLIDTPPNYNNYGLSSILGTLSFLRTNTVSGIATLLVNIISPVYKIFWEDV